MKKVSGEASRGKKLDRKTIEKNRRIHMKSLCWKMVSLIPAHHFRPPKEFLSQLDQLEQAAAYIQQLSARVEELKRKKLLALGKSDTTNNTTTTSSRGSKHLPILKLRDLGSTLEVVLISEKRRNFTTFEVISVLEEEGAEVVVLNTSNMGDKIFYTLHARVKFSRVGVDTSRICGRLHELIS